MMVADHAAPNASYRLAGIVGWPVAQSRSPLIHNYWIDKYRLSGDYVRLPVNPDQPHALRDAIAGMRAMGFAGCNLTMPHKSAALAFVDHLDPVARRMGAVNTLVFQADGAISGFNNDGYGYLESLFEVLPAWRAHPAFKNAPITVLGAGGAARAVVVALSDAGAQEIRICNRSYNNAKTIADDCSQASKSQIKVIPWEGMRDALEDCCLLINTTNQGMYGQPPLDIPLTLLPLSAVISDIIYVPLETPLMTAAKARGHTVVGGLGMLLNQARPAFQAWFGVTPSVTPELQSKVLASFQ